MGWFARQTESCNVNGCSSKRSPCRRKRRILLCTMASYLARVRTRMPKIVPSRPAFLLAECVQCLQHTYNCFVWESVSSLRHRQHCSGVATALPGRLNRLAYGFISPVAGSTPVSSVPVASIVAISASLAFASAGTAASASWKGASPTPAEVASNTAVLPSKKPR